MRRGERVPALFARRLQRLVLVRANANPRSVARASAARFEEQGLHLPRLRDEIPAQKIKWRNGTKDSARRFLF